MAIIKPLKSVANRIKQFLSTDIISYENLGSGGNNNGNKILLDNNTWANREGYFGITLDGQGGVVSTGLKGFITIPYSGTITGWDLFSDVSGSCVIDIWKDTYANFPPTVGDTIFGTKPALSSSQKNTASGLNIAVTAGDVLGFNLDSCTSITRINFMGKILKSA